MQLQNPGKGRLESATRPLSFEIGDRRQKQKPTVKWTTWLYIDCCCDTCPTRQRFPTLMVSDADLVDEDSLPEFFYQGDDFFRVLRLIEDPSDLSLFR